MRQKLVVLSGGNRDGRIHYVDAQASSMDFDNGPGRSADHYRQAEPEQTSSTALGAAVVFTLLGDAAPGG